MHEYPSRHWILTILLVLSLGINLPLQAEWGRTAEDYIELPLGPGPQICSDGNGGCWAAANPVGLCHVDRDGNLTWGNGPFTIPPATSYNPKPVLADNGDVILAMNMVYEDDNPQNVYLQRFNLDQEYVWGEGGIAIDTFNNYQGVLGVYKGPVADTYLIHWVRRDEHRRSVDWRLQLINGDGNFLWGNCGIGVNLLYASSKIVISSDQCVIAAHPLPEEDEGDLEVHKIDSDGEQVWDSRFSTRLEDIRGGMKLRDAESDRAGGVILVYEYSRLEYIDNGHRYHFGFKAMRVSGDGDSLWTRQLYEREEERQGETPGRIFPILNYAGSGRFFIAWEDYPHSFQVVALDIDGELFWDEQVDVILNPVGYGKLDAVDSDSGVCYVWLDTDHDREILQQQFGQRISTEGERLWGDRGRAIQARNVWGSSITTDGNGGVITVVEYLPTVQMINRNGEIGVVLEVGVDDDIDKQNSSRLSPQLNIYPNPCNSTTMITYSLPFASQVSLQLFDLSGRRVATLLDDLKRSGIHTATLTANDLPSGLYFVQLKASDQVFTQKVMLIR